MNISLENVTFQYSPDVRALRDVSLVITPGEAVAIIGENGAGKSTLAKHINGLLQPSSGRVQIGDWDTAEHPAAKIASRVGLAMQNPDQQLFRRTVAAEIGFGPQNLGFTDDEVQAAVTEVLAEVGLSDVAKRHPHDLHNAKKRLVALGGILAMRTPVVVFDEPTIGQDAHGIARIGRIISNLRQQKRTVIAISHNIEFCAAYFQRIIVMAQGRILADGPPGSIFNQTELLESARIEAPQLVRLSRLLGLEDNALHVPEFWHNMGYGLDQSWS